MGSGVRTAFVVAGALLAVALFVSLLERLLPARPAQRPAPDGSQPSREASRPEVREDADGTVVITQGKYQTRIMLAGADARRTFVACIEAGIARDLGQDALAPAAPETAQDGRSLWGSDWKARKRLDPLVSRCLEDRLGLPVIPPPPPPERPTSRSTGN